MLGFSARPRDPDELLVAGHLTRLLLGSSLAGAGIVLLVRSRYFSDLHSAWLATTHFALACYVLPHAVPAMVAVGPGATMPTSGLERTTADALGLHVVDVSISAVAAVLLVMALGNRPATGPLHPLLLGPVLGVSLSLVRIRLPSPELAVWAIALSLVTVLVCGIVAGRALLRVPRLPRRARAGLIAALGLIVLGSVLPSGLLDDPALVWLVVLANAGAAMLLPTSALLALQSAISTHLERVVRLEARASDAQTMVQRDRELLHELRASLAGINGATALLQTPPDSLPPERVQGLRSLLEDEMERMLRLLEEDAGSHVPTNLVVDDEIAAIVDQHHALGLDVHREPSGLSARAVRTHVQVALNVLLHNVSRHAPGASCRVSVRSTGSRVEVRVADDGPGLAPELDGLLFGHGNRGPQSPGEGIGLHSARRLLRESDGNLHVEPSGVGTVFVITLRGAA